MNTDQKIVTPVVLIEGELTDKILTAAFKVSHTLGAFRRMRAPTNSRVAGKTYFRILSVFISVHPWFQQ